ncbi:hypothetical protein AMS68_005865 [Peltaster fructicola]|uniref:Probable acetate kinase n=1 Tax=Peltaster fructicola TaxID=286661 RepID=A0A6H0Y0H4_9PEZI|nr:hypothetical protein AMS68_005865 [Peltaster fructicola]
MPNIILSINAGSSSVKVSVFANTAKEPKQLAEIQVSGLTAPPAKLKYTRGDEKVSDKEIEKISDVKDAFGIALDELINDKSLEELKKPEDIDFACHRIVHGGGYDKPIRIDKDTYHHLEALSDLAPLHNAGALEIVKAVHEKVPNCTNVAFFDSMFHQTIPEPARTYMIDREKAEKNGLRKYGFHGLSYAFITRAVAAHLKKEPDQTSIIALHLGSGASACAIKDGKSVDTTMGLTPLSGLPGATRSGDVDPSLIFHLTSDAGKLSQSSTKDLHITRAEVVLNKESGWKALSGTTDFGVVSQKAEEGDDKCKLAFDVFVDRLVSFIGSYYVKLNGEVDALVFAGGIGEKGVQLRKAVAEKVKCLGFALDSSANDKPGEDVVVDIGSKDAKHKTLICQTDEQTEMARECVAEAKRLESER